MATNGAMTALPASLTLKDAQAVLESLRQSFAADGGEVWQIDAAPVTQLDTSALAVLLECSRMAAAGGFSFACAPKPRGASSHRPQQFSPASCSAARAGCA